MSLTKGFVVAALALAPATAAADDSIFGEYRVGASFGGGMMGFVDSDTRDFATDGGAWEARLAFNTRGIVVIEGAYIGSLQNIDALGLESDARLLANGAEADLRINLMQGQLEPYVLFGAGWTRFDITNTSTNTSDLQQVDNVATMPLGAGVGYRYRNVLFDLRGTYRAAAGENLIDMHGTAAATLDTWSATFKIGFEL